MRKRRLTAEQTKAIELECVAWVLRVEPSSLDVQPGFGLSYDGAPEWLEKELQNEHGFFSAFCTVVTYGGGYGSAPKESITDANGAVWTLVGTYAHGAETECPVPENHQGKVTRDQCVLVADPYGKSKTTLYGDRNERRLRAECPMCEARLGQAHGYIYIGEGYEAVYRLNETEETEG